MALCKVLIVDDDATLRIGLKSRIAWGMHGYDLVGEAGNGLQALEIVQQEQPDIIITDMKMPVMDGIAFMQALGKQQFRGQVLVLSSYDEFDLAKQAMRLGASDYLLKLELDEATLLHSLKNACSKLEQKKQEGALAKTDCREMRQKVFRNIISNFFYTEEEMQQAFRQWDISFETRPVYCFFIKSEDYHRFEDASEEEYFALEFSILNVIEEIMGDCFQAYCFPVKTGEFYVFACALKELEHEPKDELVQQTADRLIEMLRQYLDLHINIGIGEGQPDLNSMKEISRQATEMVRSQYYIAAPGAVMWKNAQQPIQPPSGPEEIESFLAAKQRMKNALLALNAEELDKSFRKLRQVLCRRGIDENTVLYVVLEVFISIQEVFSQIGKPSREILHNSWRVYAEFLRIQQPDEALRWLTLALQDLKAYVDSENKKGYQNLVHQAKEYIEKNYAGHITLRDLSSHVHLDPSYLSTMMKKYLGMNYSEFLIHTRIEKAKELLAAGDEKLSLIAECAGYPDQFHFSRQFKRVVGISPGDYRKAMRNSGRKNGAL